MICPYEENYFQKILEDTKFDVINHVDHIYIYSKSYSLCDLKEPNINKGFDIIIDSPELKDNIWEMTLNTTYSTSGQLYKIDNILYGNKYSVIIGESLIYDNILSEKNIFPTNIPLHLVTYHNLLLVIHDIDDSGSLENYTLNIIIKLNPTHFSLSSPYEIKWNYPSKIYTNGKQNYLRIISGLCGLVYYGDNCIMEEFYTKRYSRKFMMNGFKCMHVSHLTLQREYSSGFSKWTQPYHLSYILTVLVNPDMDVDVVFETFKIPIYNIKLSNSYIYSYKFKSVGDSITNLEILTKSTVTKVKILLSYLDSDSLGTGNIECIANINKSKYGYKISDGNNLKHIITINNKVLNIIIETDEEDSNLWLKYDRCVFQTEIRRNCARYMQTYPDQLFNNIDSYVDIIGSNNNE